MGFYVVPKIGDGLTPSTAFRPKYIADMGVSYAAMDYGKEDTYLVGANLTPEQEAVVAAANDAFVVPPLADAVGGNPTLNQIVNKLEQRGIPATWIVASTTYRVILGQIGRLCMISQRMAGMHNKRLFEPGISLDSTPTPTIISNLSDVASSLGLSAAGLSTAATVRDALMLLANRLGAFHLFGEIF